MPKREKKRESATFYDIPSKSTPGKIYRVVFDAWEQWHCQCFPFFKNGTCSHIIQASANQLTEAIQAVKKKQAELQK